MIDASVLRASGATDATHPTATQCRDFLIAVLEICHRVILSDTLRVEWKNHASKFAHTWWTSMEARRKVRRVDDDINEEIRRSLQKAKLTDKQRVAVEKDLHLIEDALRGDAIVVGTDVRLTEYVAKASQQVRKLKSIRFIDPRQRSAHEI